MSHAQPVPRNSGNADSERFTSSSILSHWKIHPDCLLCPTTFASVSKSTRDCKIDGSCRDSKIQLRDKIYARCVLTCKLGSGENLYYVRRLKSLAKECTFKTVTAEEYRDEALRDSIIPGIRSPNIRQRSLEQRTATFQNAFDQA
ncbi:hypothetical protein P879_05413 [Paragonimus westermani]|uniref:Uncharacterized protein n=1 Tax=Paragonimus westermani TaxID=34504 RepID=A0A8T0DEM0_9TREM|nr:hypothetical protein P879_05413 [Paragonimus westermani]